MRVVSGKAGGISLQSPRGKSVRPTAGRVKEALFNILGNLVPGALFIDLFAGSGAVGIEALSRGARQCIFVEKSAVNINVIKNNLNKTGLESLARIIKKDAFSALAKLDREGVKVDIVFLDPPYKTDMITPILLYFGKSNLINDGLIVIEHESKNVKLFAGYDLTMQKKYGDTVLSFITAEDLKRGALIG